MFDCDVGIPEIFSSFHQNRSQIMKNDDLMILARHICHCMLDIASALSTASDTPKRIYNYKNISMKYRLNLVCNVQFYLYVELLFL